MHPLFRTMALPLSSCVSFISSFQNCPPATTFFLFHFHSISWLTSSILRTLRHSFMFPLCSSCLSFPSSTIAFTHSTFAERPQAIDILPFMESTVYFMLLGGKQALKDAECGCLYKTCLYS